MKQKSLLDYQSEARGEERQRSYTCKYCGKTFKTERGLKVHVARKHFFYYDEDVTVKEVDENHITLTITMRKSLFNDVMRAVERSGVDLCNFLSEALLLGDHLFDDEVRRYIAYKTAIRIQNAIREHIGETTETENQPTYIY